MIVAIIVSALFLVVYSACLVVIDGDTDAVCRVAIHALCINQ